MSVSTPPALTYVFGFPPQTGIIGLPDPGVFGKDLLFNGNLVISGKGDYTTVEGEENLRRAIIRRLVVRPGEYKLKPLYGVGIGSFIKKAMSKSVLTQLQHRISDNLSRDRRIEKILSVTLTPTTFGNQTGLSVVIVIQSKGKKLAFQPFNFARVQ